MTDPKRVVLAPDSPRSQFDGPLEAINFHGNVTLGREGKRIGASMSEPEARHLRDWLIEQFGLPEGFRVYAGPDGIGAVAWNKEKP